MDEPLSQLVGIYLTPELRALTKQYATKNNLSVSRVIVIALEVYLKDKQGTHTVIDPVPAQSAEGFEQTEPVILD